MDNLTLATPRSVPSPGLLNEAFELLRTVVADFVESGRRPLAATLKPVLVARTFGGFSEERLGFRTFRAFLQEAESRGIVIVRPTSQNELVVMPIGTAFAAAERTEARAERPAARPASSRVSAVPTDLWYAFVDWSPWLKRVYHLPTKRALMFPAEPIPMERPEHTAARQDLADNPKQYIEIAPISMDTHLSWMRAFAASLSESGARAALEGALATGRAISAFSTVVREPHLQQQWRAFRLEHVTETIRTWASAKGLEDDPLLPTPELPRTEITVRTPAVAIEAALAESDTERALRAKVVRAIERMPISDVKRLAIPIEYFDL